MSGSEWDEVTGAEVDSDKPAVEAEQAELYYPTLTQFVRDQLLPSYKRQIADRPEQRWCAEWWKHSEAIQRLDALWRSWELLRLDPAVGMSVWFRDHADYHMGILLSESGPFRKCRSGHTPNLEQLEWKDPEPRDLFGSYPR
jgi:hypothetical protein